MPPYPHSGRAAALRVLPLPVRRALRFHRAHGRLPSLLHPRTFNEKINWRIVFDRRELLVPVCDKLAQKEHALRVASGLVQVPRTCWSGTDLTELAAVPLPEHWVLKPNHASGLVVFGHGRPDPQELAARTRGWTRIRYWQRKDEWGYRQARPLLLVEEFVGTPGVTTPDLKVLVFDGVPRVVAVHTGRGRRHSNRIYTPDWEPLPWTGGWDRGPDAPRPRSLEAMLKAAAALADGFDMLRVDFYEHDGVLWFGECTPYPGAGTHRIEPDLDLLQGSWWTLPDLRPRLPIASGR
ncbi:hypothetical protein OF117_15270 [Geodermatophilus sp. YIM 151500]|uniref:ATP-grasp fold amidoligase family protein n=1 Tax=Geodermatophilus sp. YIM 151500 TaxID=2984531 RepID=UPI0021E46795|nr:ATP-grasp fold amidoligase family protein [Geodermatophilus sp. YIM 151500]MCV2490719.1 hypothetical protein [Geodermatophilus sp. YIM 151500]